MPQAGCPVQSRELGLFLGPDPAQRLVISPGLQLADQQGAGRLPGGVAGNAGFRRSLGIDVGARRVDRGDGGGRGAIRRAFDIAQIAVGLFAHGTGYLGGIDGRLVAGQIREGGLDENQKQGQRQRRFDFCEDIHRRLPLHRIASENVGILLDGALDFLVQPHPHIGIELGIDIDRRHFDANGGRAGRERGTDRRRINRSPYRMFHRTAPNSPAPGSASLTTPRYRTLEVRQN